MRATRYLMYRLLGPVIVPSLSTGDQADQVVSFEGESPVLTSTVGVAPGVMSAGQVMDPQAADTPASWTVEMNGVPATTLPDAPEDWTAGEATTPLTLGVRESEPEAVVGDELKAGTAGAGSGFGEVTTPLMYGFVGDSPAAAEPDGLGAEAAGAGFGFGVFPSEVSEISTETGIMNRLPVNSVTRYRTYRACGAAISPPLPIGDQADQLRSLLGELPVLTSTASVAPSGRSVGQVTAFQAPDGPAS